MSPLPTFSLIGAAAVAALEFLPGSTSAAENAVSPFADIPNVVVIYYDVAGRDAAAIRRSINAARPTDPNDGARVDGLSQWDYQWHWRYDGQGRCTASPEDITFKATVRAPRLADNKVPPKLHEKFDRYLQSLLAHEDGHLRYAWDHHDDIVEAINANCDNANEAVQAILSSISAHEVEYDEATRHGDTTIIPFQ